MPLKIITTVGTSIFTNYMDRDRIKRRYPALGKDYDNINTQYKNLESLSASDRNQSKYQSDINHIKSAIKELWLCEAKTAACAEIQTLEAIAKDAKTEIEVILLATDTVLSVLACELIKEWLDSQGKISGQKIDKCTFNGNPTDSNTTIVAGLQVADVNSFKTQGMQNLIRIIKKQKNEDTILNASGGYKVILPLLTLIGQLENIELKYLYEDSNELITIPKLPFGFDWSILEQYTTYLFDLTKIPSGGDARTQLEKLGLIEPGEPPVLSTLGELLKSYLEGNDAPFQKTTMGYFIEYKLSEYYKKHNYLEYNKVEIGRKLSDNPNQDLEDADLWMENDNGEVVLAEVKPASTTDKKLRTKIKKILGLVDKDKVKEFWIILYEYEDNQQTNDQEWCKKVITNEIRYLYPEIIFKIKKMIIDSNTIDGNRNRMRYQEFMRDQIADESIKEIYLTLVS